MAALEYLFESRRLSFRAWHQDDMDLAMGLWGDPEVTRLIDRRPQFDESLVAAKLAEQLKWREQYGLQYWPFFARDSGRDSGQHIGCSGLRPKVPESGLFELGFHICRRHWGQGYAFEAGQAVINYVEGQPQVQALYAGHHPENKASKRVLEKLGFELIGHELYEPTGLLHPAYRYEFRTVSRL